MNMLDGKVALVTGGRRGLGRAMSLALSKEGARLAVVATSSEASELAREIGTLGGELFYLQADLSRREQRAQLVRQVVDFYGRIDILVNNAGRQERAAAIDYSPADWDADISLMLSAVLDLSQQAAAFMIPQGSGKIINMASISSFQGARQIVGYATAKHGLVGLTKCLANEWAGHGINVNAIAPGIFETDMASHVLADVAKASELRGRIPAGRFGTPDDIVGPLLFLAGDGSRHVHGHVLLVDGGWMGR